MSQLVNPRIQAYKAIENSAKEINLDYTKNGQLMKKLLLEMRKHRLFSHPVFQALKNGEFNKKALQELHLDYRLIVKQFTDIILITQFKTRELSAFSDNLFMESRFLITLNIFDELGFWPGDNQYLGNPELSHFLLFDKVIEDLNVLNEERKNFENSIETKRLYNYLEESLENLQHLLVYLIITEEGAMYYSPAMREATKQSGVDVSKGYYNVHGDTSDVLTEGEDDLHQEAIVRIMQIVITEDNFVEFESIFQEVCDLWSNFWDAQYKRID